MNTKLLTALLALAALPATAQQPAGTSVPLAPAWNIASSGEAASSGELIFRVTPGNDANPVEVTVFVLTGANETGVASSIRRALNSQLDPSRYNVAAGEGANVLVTDARANTRGNSGFSLELVDSDIENVRVQVRAATPVAPPTVPAQNSPASSPPPVTPPQPGNVTSPEPAPGEPSATDGGAGAPASAPPPPSGTSI